MYLLLLTIRSAESHLLPWQLLNTAPFVMQEQAVTLSKHLAVASQRNAKGDFLEVFGIYVCVYCILYIYTHIVASYTLTPRLITRRDDR